MLRFIFGIFVLLHGLVHLLYFGQSQRLFQLQPKLMWPDESWLFTRFFGNDLTRLLASLFCTLSAIGFVTGGLAILLKLTFGKPAVIMAAVFSSLLFIFCWDGKSDKLNDKGAIGVLINLIVLLLLLVFQWPLF